jgi:hypothetical protein
VPVRFPQIRELVLMTSYERRSWRTIVTGDVIKDPRGNRVIRHVSRWSYSLEPTPDHPYEFMRNWPRVGRLKVIT